MPELNKAARQETIRYHEEYYGSHKLFEKGSWLANHDDEIMTIVAGLHDVSNPRVLDIGCGVGRNALPLAALLKQAGVEVVCLDVLDSAIEMLKQYAKEHAVQDHIKAETFDMDELVIEANSFDVILAISVLEHSKSIERIADIIEQMERGTKFGGVNRMTFSTDRRITDCETGEEIETQVETPLKKDDVIALLERIYANWLFKRVGLVPYSEELDYNGRRVIWTCTDVSFYARKPG